MNPLEKSENDLQQSPTIAELQFLSLGIVNQVISRTGFTSWLLFKAFKALHLQPKDKQIVYDTVRGFLNNLSRVEFILQRHGGINFKDMPVPLLNLLRFGSYLVLNTLIHPRQVLGLARMQGKDFFARYNRFVERVMHFVEKRGLQVLEEEGTKLLPRERIALQHSFPMWIVDLWANAFGDIFTEELCKASNERPVQDLRVNVAKRSRERVKNALFRENVLCEEGKIAPQSLVVPNGIEVFKTNSFRRALFEMQDQGSQLVTYLVDLAPGDVVLDYCAGNGGKTLQLASLAYKMDPRPIIYASDISDRKLVTLKRRVKRAFVDSSFIKIVSQGDLPHMAQEIHFTKILVDAPCSGLGNLRRKPSIKATSTPEDIAQLAEKQSQILHDASMYGQNQTRLIYITCTINPQENELQVVRFVNSHTNFVILPFKEGLQPENPILTTKISIVSRLDKCFFTSYPPLTETEGFFGAILAKIA